MNERASEVPVPLSEHLSNFFSKQNEEKSCVWGDDKVKRGRLEINDLQSRALDLNDFVFN